MLGEPAAAFHLRNKIQAALDRAGNVLLIEDLYALALVGDVQIWMSDDNSGIIFTEIVCYPRLKTVRGIVAAGRMQAVLSLVPVISRWALTMGCTKAELIGRPGWARVMSKNWTKLAQVLTADLRDIS